MRGSGLSDIRHQRPRTPGDPRPDEAPSAPAELLRARLIEEDFDVPEGGEVFEITIGEESLAPDLLQMHGQLSIITLGFEAMDRAGDPTAPAPLGCECARVLPLPSRAYDRGYCYLALSRLDRGLATRVLEDVARVLKPGGRFRFAVPDRDAVSFDRADERLLAPFGREEVFDLVENLLGFQVVSMRRFDPDDPVRRDDEGSHLLFDIRNPRRQ